MTDLTHDAFLGGKVTISQPRKGYRAGVDAVLLAAAAPVASGQTVLELGCGVGTASLCLWARVPGVTVTGVEVQPGYANIARQNAAHNSANFSVITADLRDLPHDLRQQRFDHVIANPPYFDRAGSTAANDPGRDIALAGDTPLSDWIAIAARRLAPKGYVTIIQRIDRLPEVITALQDKLGSIKICPIAARDGRAPHLFLAQARHSGRAGFILTPTLIMHEGPAHDGDRDSYRPEVRAVLRSGAGLSI